MAVSSDAEHFGIQGNSKVDLMTWRYTGLVKLRSNKPKLSSLTFPPKSFHQVHARYWCTKHCALCLFCANFTFWPAAAELSGKLTWSENWQLFFLCWVQFEFDVAWTWTRNLLTTLMGSGGCFSKRFAFLSFFWHFVNIYLYAPEQLKTNAFIEGLTFTEDQLNKSRSNSVTFRLNSYKSGRSVLSLTVTEHHLG